jgi:sigma-54 specific flagellar transcriptional regulator A
MMLPKGLRDQTKFIEEATKSEFNPVEEVIMMAQGTSVQNSDFTNNNSKVEELPLKERLADIEKNFIRQALLESKGNVSKTARLLSVQRTTLIEKINKYALDSS